ncbi:porin [Oxalobacteraceae bacterium A2-2]
MKKSLVALAVMGAACSTALAQSSVAIYGVVDVGLYKRSGGTLSEGKRDNNRIGFRGTEDLGDGLKALFQLEIRFEPDTGTNESTTRPLFQGQSRVGLQGGFGTVRLGRGLTAFQETSLAFEPWAGIPAVAGFQTDLQVAGFQTAFGSGSDPLGPAGNSGNRMANAVFYNSPVMSGFQFNATVGTKENNGLATAIIGKGTAAAPQYPVGAQASANPFSLSGTYTNGPFAGMLAYERNAIESKVWAVGATLAPVQEWKLFANYISQDQSHTKFTDTDTKAWVLGANWLVGPGKVLLGYGQKNPDGYVKTKQASVGYEYDLSKRTIIYVDASNRKQPLAQTGAGMKSETSVNYYDLGIRHIF